MATKFSNPSIAVPAILLFDLIGGATADAQVATDGTVGPRVDLGGPEFAIGAELGRQAGRNLFHSFERFSLATGERATFSGPNQIRNVVSRVTGGARSDIDGTLRSTIPGADFYFINPAGILFGPNASLDLQGSFHVSTADQLRFADGRVFSADPDAGSSFTVAAPEAFGFLGVTSGSIASNESILQVPSGETISIVGGDIGITGGPEGFVFAEGGQITLVASGAPGSVSISHPELAAAGGSSITVANQAFVGTSARVDADDDGATPPAGGGGSIVIRGGQLSIGGNSTVAAFTGNSGDSGNLDVLVDGLNIENGGRLSTDTFGGGNAGDVVVRAGRLIINGAGSQIPTRVSSDVFTGATGDGGLVQVVSNTIDIRDGRISSSTFGEGNAGLVGVRAGNLSISGANSIFPAGIMGEGFGVGQGGSVVVDAEAIDIRDSGRISSSTFSDGDAGNVAVQTDRLSINGAGSQFLTGVGSEVLSGATGGGGSVGVVAVAIELRNGGRISSSTFGAGDAGTVAVLAERLRIDGAGSELLTGVGSEVSVHANGDGGSVHVAGGVIEVENGGRISSSTFGTGEAGAVTTVADRIRIVDGATIAAFNTGGGRGGDIDVRAGSISLVSASISSQAEDAEGGRVVLSVGEVIDLRDSQILTSLVNPADLGAAVEIDISGRFLVLESSVIEIINPEGSIFLTLDIPSERIVKTPDSALRINGSTFDIGATEHLGAILVPPEPPLAISSLAERCAVRRDVGASSFIAAGRGGLPASPNAPLPSAYRSARSEASAAGGHSTPTSPAGTQVWMSHLADCAGAP